jgi:hypothetical protein
MNVDLSLYEIEICIAALDDTTKSLKEGKQASIRLGRPIQIDGVLGDVARLKTKLKAAAAEPGEDYGEDALGLKGRE